MGKRLLIVGAACLLAGGALGAGTVTLLDDDAEFYDQAESMEDARRLFEDDEEVLAEVLDDPDLMPLSYRFYLADPDAPEARPFVDGLEDAPGVLKVDWKIEPRA